MGVGSREQLLYLLGWHLSETLQVFDGCTWKGILTGGKAVDCAMEANLRTTTQLDTVRCNRSSKMSLLSCPYCARGFVRMKSFCWACATLSFAILREKRLLQGHSNSGSLKPVLAILCQQQAGSTGNMHVFTRIYIHVAMRMCIMTMAI